MEEVMIIQQGMTSVYLLVQNRRAKPICILKLKGARK